MLRWIVTLSSLVGLLSCTSGGFNNNFLPPGVTCTQTHDPFPLTKTELKPHATTIPIKIVNGEIATLPPGDYQYVSADFVYFEPRKSKQNPEATDNLFVHGRADARVGTKPGAYVGGPVCTQGFSYPTQPGLGATINVIKSMKVSARHEVTFKMMEVGFNFTDRLKYIFTEQPADNRVLNHMDQIFDKGKTQFVVWQENPIAAKDTYEIRGRVDRGTYQMMFNVKLQRRDEPAPPAATVKAPVSVK